MHDYDYTGAAGAQANGMTLNATVRASDLARVNDQLGGLLSRAQILGDQLHSHADRLKGERPTGEGKALPRPVRSGMFGALEDIIDNLEQALGYLSDGVDRNTTLA